MKLLRLGIFISLNFGLASLSTIKCFSQEIANKNINLDRLIMEIFQQQSEDVDYEELNESLLHYSNSPLNLSSASRDELQSLYILSENQLNEFFKYVEANGPLVSIFELQAIPSFDQITINKILPFIAVTFTGNSLHPKNILHELSKNENTYFLLRYDQVLERKKGYEEKKYLGSPNKLLLRMRSSTSHKMSCGITLEKDAGEKLRWDPIKNTYGADFFSLHVALHERKIFKTLIVGDYLAQFGQGLLLGSGFKFGKGAETINMVKRNNLGFRPHTSVMEAGYFRGIALTYQISKPLNMSFFFSKKNIDGNIDEPFSDSASISSITSSGFHRTLLEYQNKNRIQEMVYGGNTSLLSFNKKLHIGITALKTVYNLPFYKAPHLYNLFEFSGKENFISSADFSWQLNNFNFFGEAGISQSQGKGLVIGFISSLSKNIDASFVFRKYDQNFHTFYGKSFGENSKNINENGYYWGVKITPFQKWIFSAYLDRYYFPWIKYRVDSPTSGYETMCRLSFTPSKKIVLYFQYKLQQKEANYPNTNHKMNGLQNINKTNCLLNLDYVLSPNFAMKSRIQFSNISRSNLVSNGYYMMHELNFDSKLFSLDIRFSVFDTDDYDNRQFIYERDMRYAFTLPQLYGKGNRYYIVYKYKVNRNLEASFKYSSTKYYNTTKIGSGLEEINGNIINEVKIQLLYKI